MSAVKLCNKSDLNDGEAKRIDVEGHKLAVVRLGEDVYAIGDTCSHADFSLSEGDVYEDEKTLECWKHGSTFSLESGESQCLPAVMPVPTYELEIQGDEVLVKLP